MNLRLNLLRLLCVLLGLFCQGKCEGQGISKEYQLKLAYLYNFTKYVEWPKESFASDSSPIVIGIVGQDAMVQELSRMVQGKKQNERPFEVVAIHQKGLPRHLHMIFVPFEHEVQGWLDLRSLSKSSIVTVGESPEFVKKGGLFNFFVDSDKVRFEINLDGLEHSHLKVSSQLQKLAKPAREK